MKFSKARKIIEDEIECVKRFKEGCGHECQFCDLVKEDKEILEAYELCLALLKSEEDAIKRKRDELRAERNEARRQLSLNRKSCSNCDLFGIGCGDCEVSDDD